MLSQPRYVILMIFLGIVLLIAGFTLLVIPVFGAVSAYFLLALGVILLILAGCLSRR
ncbi:MAG: hypothetical protein ACFFD8_06225 [Candidatus Thorarchaeota archaeon]